MGERESRSHCRVRKRVWDVRLRVPKLLLRRLSPILAVTIHRSRFSPEALERIAAFLSGEKRHKPQGQMVEFGGKFGWAVEEQGLVTIRAMDSRGQIEYRLIARKDFAPLEPQTEVPFPFA